MYQIPFTNLDKPIKELVREWVDVLAQDRYEDAIGMLYQGEISPYGLNPNYLNYRWSPDLLRQSIQNYGAFDDEIEVSHRTSYKIIPITLVNQHIFESGLTVDWIDANKGNTFGLNTEYYAGIVHVGLPINLEGFNGTSDVTARLLIRKVSTEFLALELYDIHVM
jgi:hypothetical protein